MRISRELAIKINYFIDSFIPPFIRDSDLIAKILFKLIYRSEFDIFFSFKKNVLNYSYKRYDEIYKRIKKHYLQRKTNLNNKCLKKILENVKGKSVIDVGCGDGYLIRMLDNKYKIVGCDILIDDLVEKFNSNIKLVKARLEKLPFKSKSFDTVICTHTLEHIPDVISAINELKRITKKRLIVVVPKQRPYKYTFDLHVHFFPYEYSLLLFMRGGKKSLCEDVDGDLFYMEDFS